MRTVILLTAALAGISDALQAERLGNTITFEVVKTSRFYPDARKDCQSRGGDLLWTYNSEAQAAIKNNGLDNQYVWIGLDDIKNEGDWRWTSGESFKNTQGLKWYYGAPKTGRTNYDCARLWPKRKALFDKPCTWYKTPYICQKEVKPQQLEIPEAPPSDASDIRQCWDTAKKHCADLQSGWTDTKYKGAVANAMEEFGTNLDTHMDVHDGLEGEKNSAVKAKQALQNELTSTKSDLTQAERAKMLANLAKTKAENRSKSLEQDNATAKKKLSDAQDQLSSAQQEIADLKAQQQNGPPDVSDPDEPTPPPDVSEPDEPTPPPPGPKQPTTDPTARTVKKSSYQFSDYAAISTHMNWFDARATCIKQYNGDLASNWNPALRSVLGSFGRKVWLGLTDRDEEGDWTWNSGDKFQTSDLPWAAGQPDNAYGQQDCAAIESLYSIKDESCLGSKFPFVCEKNVRVNGEVLDGASQNKKNVDVAKKLAYPKMVAGESSHMKKLQDKYCVGHQSSSYQTRKYNYETKTDWVASETFYRNIQGYHVCFETAFYDTAIGKYVASRLEIDLAAQTQILPKHATDLLNKKIPTPIYMLFRAENEFLGCYGNLTGLMMPTNSLPYLYVFIHETSHAYHDRGWVSFKDKDIPKAYINSYNKALYPQSSYGYTNQKEYFAEMSVKYWTEGTKWHDYLVKEDVSPRWLNLPSTSKADPVGHEILKKKWRSFRN